MALRAMLSQRSLTPQAPGCASSQPQRAISAPRNAAQRAQQLHAHSQPCHRCCWRPLPRQSVRKCQAQADDSLDSEAEVQIVREVGEDAGVFSFASQSRNSWVYFFGVLGTVLAILYEVREPHRTTLISCSPSGFFYRVLQ